MATRKKKAPVVPDAPVPDASVAEEHRAPDQDAAIEAAFVAGTLPDEDRRDDATEAPVVNVEEEEVVIPPPRIPAVYHERVWSDQKGCFEYFTESGEQLAT